MFEWVKNIAAQLKGLWGKWSLVQRMILVGITVAAIGAVVALFSVSQAPTMAPVIDAPIRDEAARDNIIARINQEGVRAQVSASGIIMVADEKTAQHMRSLLIREDLIPQGTDPWAIFDRDRWTITDFERNVNLQRAIKQMVTEHIKALDEVDNANVEIVQPERTLFTTDQNPVTASVVITPRPGSDITENRKKIEGIQKLLKFAVEGLTDENIVIVDQNGLVLNDFTGMADADRLSLIEKQNKMIRTLEAQYRATVLHALQQIYSTDRVRDLNIKIDMDMSKKAVNTEEFFPITIKERTPGLSYDDSERVQSITRSSATSKTSWEGTGFNPEGPAGVEGQTPPAYRDMSNLYGKVNQETQTHNEEVNRRTIEEERSPTIDRVTVSVNIDGIWQRKYDEKGKLVVAASGAVEREYVSIPETDIRATAAYIQNAIGYDAARGDSVTVQNIRFDRTQQFADEDTALQKSRQTQLTVIAALIGIAILFVGFIVYQAIAKAREVARRKREEELARQHQLMRESALLEAEKEGEQVTLSVEDQARMELQEKAISLAKEHPADVGQLIRTWLMEE
jgi:flagellar M-ring protein FliF